MPLGPWFRAFLITLLIELPIAARLLREAEPRLGRRLALIAFANLATHPAVWFVFPALGLGDAPTIALAELWAVVLEALFYRVVLDNTRLVFTTGVSALANGASYGVGVVLWALGWM